MNPHNHLRNEKENASGKQNRGCLSWMTLIAAVCGVTTVTLLTGDWLADREYSQLPFYLALFATLSFFASRNIKKDGNRDRRDMLLCLCILSLGVCLCQIVFYDLDIRPGKIFLAVWLLLALPFALAPYAKTASLLWWILFFLSAFPPYQVLRVANTFEALFGLSLVTLISAYAAERVHGILKKHTLFFEAPAHILMFVTYLLMWYVGMVGMIRQVLWSIQLAVMILFALRLLWVWREGQKDRLFNVMVTLILYIIAAIFIAAPRRFGYFPTPLAEFLRFFAGLCLVMLLIAGVKSFVKSLGQIGKK